MDVRVLIALVCALCFWASAFVGIRAALPAYGPTDLALLRFIVASLSLVPFAVVRKLRPPRLADVPAIFLHGFLGFFVYHVSLNYGERTVSAASACFMIGAIPVFSAMLSAIFLQERPGRQTMLGIAVSMAGLLVIANAEGAGFSFNPDAWYVILAALASSLYYVGIKPRLRRGPWDDDPRRYDPLHYTAYTLWAGTLLLLVFAPGLPAAIAAAPAGATISVIYLGVFPGAAAYLCWNYALSRGEVGRVASSQYLMPGIAMALGWVWLREMPPALAIAGGILALSGVVVVNTGALMRRARAGHAGKQARHVMRPKTDQRGARSET
ncbi:MAG: DMT family transporter [Oceanidesulfovibrio sp.]